MRLTTKEIDEADMLAEQFFDELDGRELTVVGLAVLMVSAGFILRIASDREEAYEGLNSLVKDIRNLIDETFPEGDASIN
jgi:hypothetical protein